MGTKLSTVYSIKWRRVSIKHCLQQHVEMGTNSALSTVTCGDGYQLSTVYNIMWRWVPSEHCLQHHVDMVATDILLARSFNAKIIIHLIPLPIIIR